MVFWFGKHELTPTIEELESFLNLKHHHNVNAIFLVHKNSYFKDFQSTLNVSKDFFPKESSGDYLQCPFDLLLDRGWQKIRDFLNPTKYKAFTLTVLGQLLLSHSQHQIGEVLCNVLEQLSEGKTLAPMIIVEVTFSLSHYAWHRRGRLYGCPIFLQAWLWGHISSLPLSTPRQNPSISTPSGKKATIDYQELLTNLATSTSFGRPGGTKFITHIYSRRTAPAWFS